jgi:hypothetical protein
VLLVDFSELVYSANDGAAGVASSDLEIYTEGGAAAVASTFLVAQAVGRRWLGDAGARQLAVAVELSAGATGAERVKMRPRPGAIRDAAGWAASSLDAAVVTAVGNVLKPADDIRVGSSAQPAAALPFVAAGGAGAVLLVCLLAVYCCCRRRIRLQKRHVLQGQSERQPRQGSRQLSFGSDLAAAPAPATVAALGIVKDFEWLRTDQGAGPGAAQEAPARAPPVAPPPPAPPPPAPPPPAPVEKSAVWADSLEDAIEDALRELQPEATVIDAVHAAQPEAAVDALCAVQPGCALPVGMLQAAEKTAVWIDALAEATVDALRAVQPGCALPAGMLQAAKLAHANARGTSALGVNPVNDLEALQALVLLLLAEPTALPEGLVSAASSLDPSAAAALGYFGQAEAAADLEALLDTGRNLVRIRSVSPMSSADAPPPKN